MCSWNKIAYTCLPLPPEKKTPTHNNMPNSKCHDGYCITDRLQIVQHDVILLSRFKSTHKICNLHVQIHFGCNVWSQKNAFSFDKFTTKFSTAQNNAWDLIKRQFNHKMISNKIRFMKCKCDSSIILRFKLQMSLTWFEKGRQGEINTENYFAVFFSPSQSFYTLCIASMWQVLKIGWNQSLSLSLSALSSSLRDWKTTFNLFQYFQCFR